MRRGLPSAGPFAAAGKGPVGRGRRRGAKGNATLIG
jgi:hypothetical protein